MPRAFPMVSCLALLLLGASAVPTPDEPPLTWWQKAPEPAVAPTPAEGVLLPLLNDTWWKLKLVAKGFEVDLEDGLATQANYQTIAYMRLVAIEGGPVPVYTYEMYTETGPDQWTFEYGDSFFTDGLAENGTQALAVNTFLGFDLLTLGIGVNFTGKLTIKLDKLGALKSGKLKTLAGELTDSTLQAGKVSPPFYGSAKVTGTLIDVDDLPFELS
jgi:hypothetical protein